MAVRDSESYHRGLRLLFFCKGVVMKRVFKLKENKTTLQREVFGGLTTFMTSTRRDGWAAGGNSSDHFRVFLPGSFRYGRNTDWSHTETGLLAPDGSLPRARCALLANAVGKTAFALLGTSTVTSYIESPTGVIAAARTGLANMGAGVFFVMAMFLHPS